MVGCMDRNRSALRRQGGWRYGLLLVPLLFLCAFFLYPLASILLVSLAPEGKPDLDGFFALVRSSYYLETLWFTTWQAALSTLLTVLLALPGAYVFSRYQFPGKSLLLSLATLPFVLPTIVVAVAFQALIGERGVVNHLLMNLLHLEEAPIALERTLALVLIAHVFYNYPLVLRMVSGYWANQSLRMEESARVLGAHGWRLWWYIRLPVLRPVLLASSALVFIFTFTSFGLILLLGGLRFATLEVEIYRQAISLFHMPTAAALSLVQIGLMFVLMLAYTRVQARLASDVQRAERVARPVTRMSERLLLAVNLLLMTVLLFAPLAALVWQSFTYGEGGFSLRYYEALDQLARGSVLFTPPLDAILNSLQFAGLTTIFGLILGVLSAYLLNSRRGRLTAALDALFMLPLATSAVTLGLGFLIAPLYVQTGLRTSPLLIVLAHTLVAMPFVVRSVLPALRAIPPNIQGAARVLGASPWQVWRLIDLPLLARGLVVGATFAFTVSMGEFGASLFIARPNTPTMPLVIFRLIGQPGALNYGQALAMSSLLLAVCALAFLLIERFRHAGMGEF